MSIELSEIFEAAGFHVQKTEFSSILPDRNLREVIQSEFGKIDLSSILVNYPSFFLMHSSADPEKGYLFAAEVGESRQLPAPVSKLYESYFPPELMLVSVNAKKKTIQATWFDQPNDWTSLGNFFSSEIGISNLQEFKQTLKSQGWNA